MYPWIAVWLDGVTAGMLLSAVTKIVNPIDFTKEGVWPPFSMKISELFWL